MNESGEEAPVRREALELRLDDAPDPPFQTLRRGQLAGQFGGHLPRRLFVEGHDQVVLRAEVVVRRPRGHPGRRGHVAHGGRFEAPLPEKLQRRGQNPLSCLLGFRGGKLVTSRHRFI